MSILSLLFLSVCFNTSTDTVKLFKNEKIDLPLALAVGKAESLFNPKAVSKSNAKGLMQLTPIGLKEARRHCELPESFKYFNPAHNIAAGTCLLEFYIRQGGGVKEGLILYNSGYRGLNKYKKHGRLFNETKGYLKRIKGYLRKCGVEDDYKL